MNSLLEVGLGGAERLLGVRFLVAVLLPILLATGTSALVGLTATGQSLDDAIKAWQHYSASGELLAALWLVLGLVGVSYVFAFFQLPLLRILEGYWPQKGMLGAPRRRRTEWHQHKATSGWDKVQSLHHQTDQTHSSALAARLLTAYPPPPRLKQGCLPTALGNRLSAAEYYPLERYGIDAVVIWPRLRPLLPPEAADRITGARTALDATVSLVGLSIAFGIIWPLVLLVNGHGSLAALCLLAWPVAWAAYTAGVQAAAAYGQEVRVVFDLYRHLLLRHLEFDIPCDSATERRQWDDLAQFYLRNVPFAQQPAQSPRPLSEPPKSG